MTRTLILPAEIHSREFDARLLHGIIALQRGWRVIVGSKALINRAIWRMPRGIYLCQTITHKRVPLLKLLRRLGFVAFGWDEEGLIYLNREVYLMRRVSVETLSLLSSVITWGPQGAEDVVHRSRALGLLPMALGNPRFDLLRPELRSLYADEVAAIRAACGRFVLINTNFSSLNPVISIHDLKPRTTSAKHPPTEDERTQFADMQKHRSEVLKHFQEDLPRFVALHPETQFVLRAHPGENEAMWRDVFAQSPNVKVVREGSSIPWLIAADALLHNNCTTAVEAAIIGLPPICYCPVVSLRDESALPNPISHRAYDLEQLAEAMNKSVTGSLTLGATQLGVLTQYVSATSGPLACDRIMDHLEGITVPAPNRLSRCVAASFGALRQIFKSSRRGHITDRYMAKVFPPLSSEDVEERSNQIAEALQLTAKIQVRQTMQNVFELSLTA